MDSDAMKPVATTETLAALDAAMEAVNSRDDMGEVLCLALVKEHGPALREALVAMQWRPIETAPKDSERILMLMKHGAIEGVWDGEVGSGYYWRDMSWYPTHWMPLPAPPAMHQEAK